MPASAAGLGLGLARGAFLKKRINKFFGEPCLDKLFGETLLASLPSATPALQAFLNGFPIIGGGKTRCFIPTIGVKV